MNPAAPLEVMKGLSDLKVIAFVLSGGMALVFLVVIFNFLRPILASKSDGIGGKGKRSEGFECKFEPFRNTLEFKDFSTNVRVAHDKAQGSIDRVEMLASKENDCLVKIGTLMETLTKTLDKQNSVLDEMFRAISRMNGGPR